MCGIAGIFNLNGKPVDERDLHLFNHSMSHRGPDQNGIWCDGPIGFAHTRLSIIDLSENGRQPMCNEDGTVWITYNGEIYNFEEIRKTLIALGHRFNSGTDTEVIIHLYEEKGVQCLEFLRGMFAFAIWDSKKKRLFIARDRIGKKPLLYTIQNKAVVFASELKAIKALPWVDLRFNPGIFAHVFGYDHVPWVHTMYENVFKVQPSGSIIFQEHKDPYFKRYWKINFQKKVNINEDEASHELSQLLAESVRLRLRSDVPLGMFLSGGVDSSYIVGIASRLINEPINTFSIGYEDCDTKDPEYHYSNEVSQYFQTKHSKIIFDKKCIDLIPEIIHFYDEPFCIPNALAHYQLCRETRNSVKVALTGDGADEIFGGYDIYKKLKAIDLLSVINPWRNATFTKSRPIPTTNNLLLALYLLKIPRAFRRGFLKHSTFSYRIKNLFAANLNEHLSKIYIGDILDRFYLENDVKFFMDGVLYTDLLINYAWSTTIATDISSMANSLEVRSPFLDHKVVEFAFSLPVNMKIGANNREKKILYKVSEQVLPANIVKRKKMSYGIGIPYQKLFFNEWQPFVKEVVFDDKIKKLKFFNYEYLIKSFKNPNQDAENFKSLWKIFCMCVWINKNL